MNRSEITETDPMNNPTTSFPATSDVLEMTESHATADLRRCASIAPSHARQKTAGEFVPRGRSTKNPVERFVPRDSIPAASPEGPAASRVYQDRLFLGRPSLPKRLSIVNSGAWDARGIICC